MNGTLEAWAIIVPALCGGGVAWCAMGLKQAGARIRRLELSRRADDFISALPKFSPSDPAADILAMRRELATAVEAITAYTRQTTATLNRFLEESDEATPQTPPVRGQPLAPQAPGEACA